MDTTSYWTDSRPASRFEALEDDLEVDVVVIGAGITGATAGYLFKQAGQTVAVLDRGTCGGFDTTHTTAHLTQVTDKPLHKLVSVFGEDAARAVWDAGRVAIDQIFDNIRWEKIDCDFRWVSGYYHAPSRSGASNDPEAFYDDARLANDLGFEAEFLDAVPWAGTPGIRFAHQAKFHPVKYVHALLKTIPGEGSHVFDNTEAGEIVAEPFSVRCGKRSIRCKFVVLATHTPLMGKTNVVSAALLQSKLFLYTSYSIGAKIPKHTVPEACFWDTDEPYHYLRIDRGDEFDFAIFGGEDHKTGQADHPHDCYDRLERSLREAIPSARVTHRWSGQVIETPDGLPYIGETSPGQFIATGFSGNGMTFGTLAAMMAVDAFHKRTNPWKELFQAERKTIFGGAFQYLKENKDYPYYMLRQHLAEGEETSPESLPRNQGRILKIEGKKVAAFRDGHGKLTLCSPICPHLKCVVKWNDAENTWDCPCHGSRFAATGEVLSGPAEAGLSRMELSDGKPVETPSGA